MLNYFEANPKYLRIVSGSSGDSKAKQRIWIELAHRLNSMEGTLKSTAKWSKYWNDIIIYTKNRAHHSMMGTKIEKYPTEFDKKILHIIGQNDLLKNWIKSFKQNKHVKLEENISEMSEFDEDMNQNLADDASKLNLTNNLKSKSAKIKTENISIIEENTNLKSDLENFDENSKNQDENLIEETKMETLNSDLNSVDPSAFQIEMLNALNEFPRVISTLTDSFILLSNAINRISSNLIKLNEMTNKTENQIDK